MIEHSIIVALYRPRVVDVERIHVLAVLLARVQWSCYLRHLRGDVWELDFAGPHDHRALELMSKAVNDLPVLEVG